ncbi:MAG TPA: MBL fold metallo-hydrolase [Anaeromyxobacteraceae bacterium]|nr:MBL fold metallo-hydrolase [Anaeromyxobacteraceae bacterium]
MTTRIPLGPSNATIESGSVLFVGTATTVIRLGPFTLLTDPNFLHAGDHAHLGYGLRSRRLTNPAIEIDDLPRLDACVLSHFHGDHWDEVATARLPRMLPVLTTPHAASALRARGFGRALALRTWEDAVLEKGVTRLRVTALPGRHGPAGVARLLPQVMGSLVEVGEEGLGSRYRIYVSGDTLVFDDLREIPERFPDVDLGLFHLGGTRVLGVLVTMDDRQGIEAIRIIRPRLAIPIHYDDYTVFKSPLEDFVRAVERSGLGDRVRYLGRGERYDFPIPSRRIREAEVARPDWPRHAGPGLLEDDPTRLH